VGPQNRFGGGGEERSSLPLPGLGIPIILPVTQRCNSELCLLLMSSLTFIKTHRPCLLLALCNGYFVTNCLLILMAPWAVCASDFHFAASCLIRPWEEFYLFDGDSLLKEIVTKEEQFLSVLQNFTVLKSLS
jgi:hypothetical protein